MKNISNNNNNFLIYILLYIILYVDLTVIRNLVKSHTLPKITFYIYCLFQNVIVKIIQDPIGIVTNLYRLYLCICHPQINY